MKRALLVLGPSSVLAALVLACGASTPTPQATQGAPLPAVPPNPDEAHPGDVKQLTLSGENAEAYWSWGGRELVL